jgi:hypothetical protein
MPLRGESHSAAEYIVPGTVAGVVAYAFSRIMIEPRIDAAVDYERARDQVAAQLANGSHAHGHELASRAVQENVGTAVGVIAFGIAMGVLFAVVQTVTRAALERRGFRPNSTGLALLLSAGMFVAIVLAPGLKYPANPPTVGLPDTIGARSSAFLTMTVVSTVAAGLALAAVLAWSRQWGVWRSTAIAAGGYTVVILIAMGLLPSFHEVPGALTGPDGLVLDGFPAEVLAEFRVYSMTNQGLMWLVIGATSATLAARWMSTTGRAVASPS